MARHLSGCREGRQSEAMGANMAGERMSEGAEWLL